MKIEKNKLKTFLTKTKFSGEDELREVILNFGDNGLEINAVCLVKTSMVNGILKKEAFEEYEAFGEIGIMNLPNLLRVMDSFDKTLNISVDGNLLVVSEASRKVEVEYADPDVISKTDISLDIEFDEEFTIESSIINKFIARASINTDFDISLITDEGKLTLTNSKGAYKFTEEVAIEGLENKLKATFGKSLVNVIAPLSGEVKIFIKEDAPLKIVETTDDSQIELITSPLTNN